MLLLFFGLFLAPVPSVEAEGVSCAFMTSQKNPWAVNFQEAFQQAMERVQVSLDETGVLSLEELGETLPEALALGTPFLFDSSQGVAFFFEDSQWWKLLKKRFDEKGDLVLVGPVEARGFFGLFSARGDLGNPPSLDRGEYAFSRESEKMVLHVLGGHPRDVFGDGVAKAFLEGTVEGCLFPWVEVEPPRWLPRLGWAAPIKAFYDFRFLTVPRKHWEALSDEERAKALQALEEVNRALVKEREEKIAATCKELARAGVSGLSCLENVEDSPGTTAYKVLSRKLYAKWLTQRVAPEWITLIFQDARSANSMATGQ